MLLKVSNKPDEKKDSFAREGFLGRLIAVFAASGSQLLSRSVISGDSIPFRDRGDAELTNSSLRGVETISRVSRSIRVNFELTYLIAFVS